MNTNDELKNETANGTKPVLGAVKSDKWVFCNTELEPHPYEWSSEYKCPKCGNYLVNVLGTCATKIYS